jgi:hypothetical protein
MAARQTPKQALLTHILSMHGLGHPRPAGHWTLERLRKWHAHTHHRFSPNHFHAGPNLGPDQRPPGWYTGADAVLLDRDRNLRQYEPHQYARSEYGDWCSECGGRRGVTWHT